MKVEKFEEDGIGGMRSTSVAAAGTQVRGERKSVRETGQRMAKVHDFQKLGFRLSVPQSLLEMNFELAEKAMASRTSSHDRPPENQRQAATAARYERGVSCLPEVGTRPAGLSTERRTRKRRRGQGIAGRGRPGEAQL